MEELTPPD